MRTIFLEWTQIVANIIVPLAFLLTAISFWNQTNIQKINSSDAQIDRFYSEELTKSRSIIFSIWSNQDISFLSKRNIPRGVVESFIEKIIQNSNTSESDFDASLINITSYFDRLEVCISEKRCDEDVIISHVGNYGQRLYCIYRDRISALNTDTLLFGLGENLEKFSRRSGAC